MNDLNIIAIVSIICLTIILLGIIWKTIVYKQDSFRLKSNTSIKTDLHNRKINSELSVDIDLTYFIHLHFHPLALYPFYPFLFLPMTIHLISLVVRKRLML